MGIVGKSKRISDGHSGPQHAPIYPCFAHLLWSQIRAVRAEGMRRWLLLEFDVLNTHSQLTFCGNEPGGQGRLGPEKRPEERCHVSKELPDELKDVPKLVE